MMDAFRITQIDRERWLTIGRMIAEGVAVLSLLFIGYLVILKYYRSKLEVGPFQSQQDCQQISLALDGCHFVAGPDQPGWWTKR